MRQSASSDWPRSCVRRSQRSGSAVRRTRQPPGVHPQRRRHRQSQATQREGAKDGEEEAEGARARCPINGVWMCFHSYIYIYKCTYTHTQASHIVRAACERRLLNIHYLRTSNVSPRCTQSCVRWRLRHSLAINPTPCGPLANREEPH